MQALRQRLLDSDLACNHVFQTYNRLKWHDLLLKSGTAHRLWRILPAVTHNTSILQGPDPALRTRLALEAGGPSTPIALHFVQQVTPIACLSALYRLTAATVLVPEKSHGQA